MANILLVVGDLHLHWWRWKQLNLFQEAFLREIVPSIIQDQSVGRVIFLGDIFHDKKKIDKRVLGLFTDGLKTLSALVDKIHILVGNHDLYAGENTLRWVEESFEGKVSIHSSADVVFVGATPLVFLPYGTNGSEAAKIFSSASPNAVVFSHLDLSGVPYVLRGGKKIFPEGTDDGELVDPKEYAFSLWVNGHYHTPDHSSGIINLGSVFPTTVTEEGQEKYVAVVSLNGQPTIKYIPTGSPKIIVVKDTEEAKAILEKGKDIPVLRPEVWNTNLSPTRRGAPTKAIDLVSEAKKIVSSLAKDYGFDPSYGLALIDEVTGGKDVLH